MRTTRFSFQSHHLALAGVLLLTTFLSFFRLGQEGYGNLYYAAAVRSMLMNWHNFFFVSSDPMGLVTVDKPPLGLWVQTISAAAFGFSGWSVIAPQALSAVIAVGLVYMLVKRVFGPWPGVLSALVMALTPISVAASRNNTMDTQLVVVLLLAAWAFSTAARQRQLRWLLVGSALVGVGFNIKMGQAYLVLPALGLLYMICAPISLWKRVWQLGAALALMVAISLSWALAVDLTPPDQRPYVGSSGDNTVIGLILGHNTESRLPRLDIAQILHPSPSPAVPAGNLTGQPPSAGQQPLPGFTPSVQGGPPQTINAAPPPGGGGNNSAIPDGLGNELGPTGVLRLFNKQMGGQVSWLLALAIFGLVALDQRHRWQWPPMQEHQTLILWGVWLLPQMIVFSFGGLLHRYYLAMMAPAVAALVGSGMAVMWRDLRSHHRMGWLLPVAFVMTGFVQGALLAPWPDWEWIIVVMGVLCTSGAAILAWVMISGSESVSTAFTGAALGLCGLLVAPVVWLSISIAVGGDGALPYAGPDLLAPDPLRGGAGNSDVIAYVKAHNTGPGQVVATLRAAEAAQFTLAGQPAIALGGFSGRDEALTLEEFRGLIQTGRLRFVWITPQEFNPPPGPGGGPPLTDIKRTNVELVDWIVAQCGIIEASVWSKTPLPPSPGPAGSPNAGLKILFDCGRAR